MRIGLVSTAMGRRDSMLSDLIDEAKAAESAGYHFLSLPHVFGFDAITTLALIGRQTQRIELTTGVVPSPPRHPVAIAQQALTAQAACDGRFVLGIGLSHKIVIEDMLGLSYARPALQMREYVEVLAPLLEGRPAAFKGEIYRVNVGLQVAGVSRVPLIVAALGPRMLQIAGELADGTATWMTGRKTLARHVVPSIREAAKQAGRSEPRVIAALPICITDDPAAARERAARLFQVYGTLPSYRAMLDREGVEGPADVALVGDEREVRACLRELADSGVSDLAANPFGTDSVVRQRTREFLAEELAALA